MTHKVCLRCYGLGVEDCKKEYEQELKAFAEEIKKNKFEIVHSSGEGTSCMLPVVSVHIIDKLLSEKLK